MIKTYYRPIVMHGLPRPADARTLAGGWCWFETVEQITRNGERVLVHVNDMPNDVLDRLCQPRADIAGLDFTAPRIMGILNVTPDSFSDGGKHNTSKAAQTCAAEMVALGADILDIGGESTRPGADFVSAKAEISRTSPVIADLHPSVGIPISIDTRKHDVAKAAIAAGADIINDVSALTFEPKLMALAANTQTPVCLMHAQGSPETMQDDPAYGDVVLDVYDYLEGRIEACVAAGIPRDQIMIDPGIGFGKTTQHCLELLRDISIFHALGCVVLLGVSRKRFIGDITGANSAEDRVFGTVAATLGAISQGVQLHRVHDIMATKQAIDLQWAVTKTGCQP